jgi:hypothetical protein
MLNTADSRANAADLRTPKAFRARSITWRGSRSPVAVTALIEVGVTDREDPITELIAKSIVIVSRRSYGWSRYGPGGQGP